MSDCWRVSATRADRRFALIVDASDPDEAAAKTRQLLEDDSSQRRPPLDGAGPLPVRIDRVVWLHAKVGHRHGHWSVSIATSLLPREGKPTERGREALSRRSLVDRLLNGEG